MSRSILRALARVRRAALASLLGALLVLPAPAARAQLSSEEAAELCLDLTQPPRDVGDACRIVADNLEMPIESRTAAAFRAGGAYQRIDDFVDAEAAYSVAIELNPSFAEAYAARAVVREKLGDIPAAEEDHNAAIELTPNDPVLIYNRGVFYFRADRDTEARADFYTVTDLDPSAAWPYVYLGAMDDLSGADALALESYERAFALDSSILQQFQLSMESQGFDPGLPGEYTPEMRAGLVECMKIDCIIGVNE